MHVLLPVADCAACSDKTVNLPSPSNLSALHYLGVVTRDLSHDPLFKLWLWLTNACNNNKQPLKQNIVLEKKKKKKKKKKKNQNNSIAK